MERLRRLRSAVDRDGDLESPEMKAIGYVRVSTNKQENSRDAQESKVRDWARVKDFELVQTIVDFDEFSGDLNRPGVQQVIALVKAKKVNAVIFTKLDRFTRSTRDVIEMIELFTRHGVAMISIAESLDTESPMGRFFVRLIASIGELEREMIGERTREVMQHLKKNGMPAGKTPYGWKSQGAKKPLLKDAHEQNLIEFIRARKGYGESLQGIAERLNRLGHLTRSGKPWQKQYVANVLKGAKCETVAG
jgi:site-specific DNA recombinase